MGFRFVDLFAGVGGFHRALADLGGECVFACESDSACQQVYRENFDAPLAGDIVPLTEDDDAARTIPEHDVLCAGFPCQPFSKSGFQRGIGETRGTLFFNILKVLEAHRPPYAILENVRNLAGPRQRDTWETIVRNLRRLGYRVADEPAVFSPHLLPPPTKIGEPSVPPEQADGSPQVRERVFILCEHVGEDAPSEELRGQVLLDNRPVHGWDPDDWRIEDWLLDDHEIADVERYQLPERERRWIDAWQAFVQRIDSDWLPGFPIWVDEFRDTPITEGLPAWKADFHRKNSAFYLEHKATIDVWIDEFDVMSFPHSRRKFEWQARKWQPKAHQRDLWELVMHLRPSGIRVKTPTYLPSLVAITQTSVIGSRQRRITPREAARLMGLPDYHWLHPQDPIAYKQLGNAVHVGVAKHVAKVLFGQEGSERRQPALSPAV